MPAVRAGMSVILMPRFGPGHAVRVSPMMVYESAPEMWCTVHAALSLSNAHARLNADDCTSELRGALASVLASAGISAVQSEPRSIELHKPRTSQHCSSVQCAELQQRN